jgi:hypothetical protein
MCPRLLKRQIIARAFLLIAVAALLAACSVARVAYNQAPKFSYWWLDAYVDFTDTQSTQVRQDIDRFVAWHRKAELPKYAGQLAQWQVLATQELTPAQACQQFDLVRAAYLRSLERSLEPLAALALRLSPEQLKHMQRHQQKGVQAFEKEYLSGDPADRFEDRLDRYIDRYETLYGSLSERQHRLLRGELQRSSFDPERSLAERVRRQEALLNTIGQLQADPVVSIAAANGVRPVPKAAVAAVRAWTRELLESPTPGYTDYTERQISEGCTQFAAMHNSTSPEQRSHAVQLLQRYQDDLRALSAQD